MDEEPGFCPRCGSPGGAGLRYCRQCGTDLRPVANRLDASSKEGLWIVVRGVICLVLSVPFALLLLFSLGSSEGMGTAILLALQAVLLTFAYLGVRDIARVLAAGKASAMPLQAKPTSPQLETPPSIVEHTTFPLGDVNGADTNETLDEREL